MCPHRRLMDPSTLEMLLLLRFNKNLWNKQDVETVMTRVSREQEATNVQPNTLIFTTPTAPLLRKVTSTSNISSSSSS